MGLTATIGSFVGLDQSTGGHGDKAVTGGKIGKAIGKLGPKAPVVPASPVIDERAMRISAEDARRREAQKAAAAYGRSDTILTGGLGLIGDRAPAGQRKTLLGL